MLLTFLSAIKDSLHKDGTILDYLKQLLASVLGYNSVGDEQKLWLV